MSYFSSVFGGIHILFCYLFNKRSGLFVFYSWELEWNSVFFVCVIKYYISKCFMSYLFTSFHNIISVLQFLLKVKKVSIYYYLVCSSPFEIFNIDILLLLFNCIYNLSWRVNYNNFVLSYSIYNIKFYWTCYLKWNDSLILFNIYIVINQVKTSIDQIDKLANKFVCSYCDRFI